MGQPIAIGLLISAAMSVFAENQILVSGGYGGTLGAGAATAIEPIAMGQNPAALHPPSSGTRESSRAFRAGFQLDFHRPYGLEELQVADAGAFCDFPWAGLGISWRETRVGDWYRDRILALNPRLRLGPSALHFPWPHFPGQLDLGATWNIRSTEIPGEGIRWNGNQGYGMAWRLLPRLKLGAFVLGVPWPGSRSPAEPVWQWGIAADSRGADAKEGSWPRQTLYLDFRKTGDGPWRALGALALTLHPSLRVTAGLSTPPFQISFGLKVGWGGLDWNQALRYHRYLGRTSLSGLAFSR